MKNERKEQIVAAIKKEMKQTETSQNVWAKQSGILSAATLSNILRGRWENVSEEMWTALEALALSYDWGYYPTVNANTIEAACQDAQRNNKFNVITAYTGAGKSTALNYYKRNNQNVYMLTCRSSFGAKDMASRIVQAIGIQTTGSRLIDVEDAIIRHLISTPNCLLILDSVSKLRKDAALQFVGDLAEAIEGKAGLLVAGTEYLRDYVQKCVRVNKRGFRELNRRVFHWTSLEGFNSQTMQRNAVQICRDQGITKEAQIKMILKQARCMDSLKAGIEKMQEANKSIIINKNQELCH